jgi:hypothetical protein
MNFSPSTVILDAPSSAYGGYVLGSAVISYSYLLTHRNPLMKVIVESFRSLGVVISSNLQLSYSHRLREK